MKRAREISLELLKSEHFRASILAGVFGFAFVFAGVTWLLDGTAMYATISGLALVLASYELLVRRFLRRRIQLSEEVWSWAWYVNATVEVSVLTFGLWVLSHGLENPVYTLQMPGSLVYFTFILLSTLRLDYRVSLFTGVLSGVEFMVLASIILIAASVPPETPLLYTSTLFYVQKSVLFVVGGITSAIVAREVGIRLHDAVTTQLERNRIMTAFGQHTSPEIVQELMNQPDTGAGRYMEVAVLFLDIRGFTAYAEQRKPEEVVAYLNTLFGFMIEIINRRGGIVHQLLGDGFMALFGVPASRGNDARHAVEAAQEILDRIEAEMASGNIESTRVGIGIHTGPVLTGMVGSDLHREYKVTGDVVNLASRIEQFNKKLGSQLLVSEAVLRESGLGPATGPRTMVVRGRSQPVAVYRLR